MARRITTLAAVGIASIAAASLAGCRGDVSEDRPRQFLPDLDDQFKYKPQTESHFFTEYTTEDGVAYGRSMREPIMGTVAFGARPFTQSFDGVDFAHRNEYLRPDSVVATGRALMVQNGRIRLDDQGQPVTEYVQRIPIPVTRELLRLGQKKFSINCLPCHGATGQGDGMVGRRWATPLPTWHDDKYQPGGEFGRDGYIFHTIRHGLPNPGGDWPLKMPSYARKLTIEETWAVVAYFRALQTHRRGTIDMLPEAMRLELERQRADASRDDAEVAGGASEGGAS